MTKKKTNSKKNGSKSEKQRDKASQNCPKGTEKTGKPWMPKPAQIKIVELLIDLDDNRNKEEKCLAVGITRRTLYNWFQDPNFVKFMNEKLELSTDADLMDMWKALKSKGKRGDVQAIRTYFELKGKLKNQMEVTGKNGGPIETNGNVQVVFGMAEPPGKREDKPEDEEEQDE